MRRGALLLILCVTASCGVLDSPSYMPPGASDATCYDDTDCAPNACCGEGDAVVHANDAPACGAVQCTGSCPRNSVNCGCGVPLCRDGRCVAAVSPDC